MFKFCIWKLYLSAFEKKEEMKLEAAMGYSHTFLLVKTKWQYPQEHSLGYPIGQPSTKPHTCDRLLALQLSSHKTSVAEIAHIQWVGSWDSTFSLLLISV